MKRALLAIASGATFAFALAAQTASPLTAWTSKLAELKSLKADITVQTVGQGTQSYAIALQKPNMARIESAGELFVADGKKLTVLNKTNNTYYSKDQTDGELKAALKPDQYALVRAFFNADEFRGTVSKAQPQKTVGGETVTPVLIALDSKGDKTMTLYIGKDNLVRKADRQITTGAAKSTAILTARNLVTGGELGEDEFAFKAPNDSSEINYEDLMASKWFTDLDEAKAVAKASGRKIFIDFFATWCGPCKKLEAEVFGTDEFKALSKKFVFLRIDVDAQPQIAQSYNIEAMPTQAVTDAEGSELGRTVGYANPQMFFDFINKY